MPSTRRVEAFQAAGTASIVGTSTRALGDDVRNPLAGGAGPRQNGSHDRELRSLLPGGAQPRSALRRPPVHGGHVDRDLLPPELSGADAEATERTLLPLGRRGGGGRLPGLQALPPRPPAGGDAGERAGRPARPG